MQKNIGFKFNVGSNEYFASESLINLHEKNIEESDKQDIVTNIAHGSKNLEEPKK